MGPKKNIEEIKDSIINLNKLSLNEKNLLKDSIEMLWLNSGLQKNKVEPVFPSSAEENIYRIRQLLAAAWSEDFKN